MVVKRHCHQQASGKKKMFFSHRSLLRGIYWSKYDLKKQLMSLQESGCRPPLFCSLRNADFVLHLVPSWWLFTELGPLTLSRALYNCNTSCPFVLLSSCADRPCLEDRSRVQRVQRGMELGLRHILHRDNQESLLHKVRVSL